MHPQHIIKNDELQQVDGGGGGLIQVMVVKTEDVFCPSPSLHPLLLVSQLDNEMAEAAASPQHYK